MPQDSSSADTERKGIKVLLNCQILVCVVYFNKGVYMLYAVVYTSGVKKFTGKAKESRNGENMSNLKGISEKCCRN